MKWLSDKLAELEHEGLLRRRQTVQPLPDGWCEVDGQRLLNLASNDYLNLARHPSLIAAARMALEDSGVGATASALVCGHTVWHDRLEQALAGFEQQPAAILFPTGMAANLGAVAALAGPEDVVFCDRLNHASLVDGCRLSGAKLRVYRHTELDRLEQRLHNAAGYRRRWIVTDAVFSMDGNLAPLPRLCELADRFDAQIIVDEAHGTGVFGAHGRGVCEHFGVEHRGHIRVGTLSKSLGALGGFVAGPQQLIDFLWNAARTQLFSTALPPAICAAATAAVTALQLHPEWPRQLRESADLLRRDLSQRGIQPLDGSIGPIVPIVVGEPVRTLQVAAELKLQGFLVGAIRPPTVPRGTSRLRVSVTRAHSEQDLTRFADALARVLNRV